MDDLVIRKDNHIVQKTLNRFTYKQNQLMAILLGKYVNLKTDECINTSVSIDTLRKTLGVSDGADNYKAIERAIQKFGENSSIGCWEEIKKGKWEYVWRPYFKEIRLSENGCRFEWNELMKPYLIKLQDSYTQYLANDYLKLKSVHSQNLYEQLKSLENYQNKYKKKPLIPVEELRNVFQVQGKKYYESFRRLNEKLLKKAVYEINEVTDLSIKYYTHKQGRTVVAVEFEIKRKKHNMTKSQKEGLPEWYSDTEQHEPTQEMLERIEKMKKELQIELGNKV